ncbi:MAG: putative Ig domain-containing protein [Halofilum sp. (in: g-proteobacteria)]|nr:putative Ig domain-containing protein [Halofilum sp. (in: g-proteobacteria)]
MACGGSDGGQFTINADGSYDFDPNGAFEDLAVGESRDTSVSYRITDGEGGTDTATLTVTVNGENDVPTGRDIPDDQTPFGAPYENDVSGAFDDIDEDDTLTFSTDGLPDGLSIDPETGEIGGIPLEFGLFEVTVTATDNTGASVSEPFLLRVTPPAATPVDPGPPPANGPVDPGLAGFGDGNLLDAGADDGLGGVTIDLGLPDLLRQDGLGTGLDGGLDQSGADLARLQYQATQSDGRPLPPGLTVDADTGEIKGQLPPGMETAELRVIGVDDKGNTRTHEVTVDADGNIVSRARADGGDAAAESGYHRMEVNVDADGRITVVSGRDSTNGMIAESIRMDAGSLRIDVLDSRAYEVARYTGRLTSGEPLPDGLQVDPRTGRVTGSLPAGRDSISIQVIAEQADGQDRTLQIDLRLSAPTGADASAWDGLGGQIERALAAESDPQAGTYGSRLLAALGGSA